MLQLALPGLVPVSSALPGASGESFGTTLMAGRGQHSRAAPKEPALRDFSAWMRRYRRGLALDAPWVLRSTPAAVAAGARVAMLPAQAGRG